MRSGPARLMVFAGIVLACAIYFPVYSTHWRIGNRVYRIGWHEDPPFQEKGPDGAPTGLAIDLVREGARRAGIRLQWVWSRDNSEDALRSNQVDLWPLITITPERRRFLYISDPYMQHENSFLVRAESPYYQFTDLGRATISHVDQPMPRRLVHAALPDARLVGKRTYEETIESVCLRQTDAAFLEEYSAVSMLLKDRPCPSLAFRLISAPKLRSRLGVGSTFATSAVADLIREEIGNIPEPVLTALVTRWGYFAPRNLESINAMLNARRRERRLTQFIFLFACLFALTVLAADRIRRQKNRINKLHSEITVRESEARFRNMADAAPVMIWVSGTDKNCTFFNKGWLNFTGRTLEQEFGDGWAAGVHPDDLNRCLEIYSSSFDARRSFSMEYRLRRADGEYRWLLDNGVPSFNPNGDFIGYVGACTDITDLKGAQEKIFASQKFETVGRLTAGIAHDFNNLLGSVLAHAELASAELAGGSVPQEALEKIRDVAIRGAEIVRQLMIYAGQENAVVEPVNISGVVEDTLELLKVSISKSATLDTHLAERVPAVCANPAQLRQIVMNLVTNASEAIEAVGEGIGVIRITTGEVTVTATSLAESRQTLPPGNYVQLEISDTGSGMTQEAQARIFDPFFTTKFAGRGLGLAVVAGIVRTLGGAINVMSTPGVGTTFQILFPPADDTLSSGGPSAMSATGEQAGKPGAAVLIVEDEDTLRVALSMMLERKGFTAVQASDGSAALDLIRSLKQHVDVMLLDLSLPGASSQEVFAEARRLRPGMAVILTSAYGQEKVVAEFGGARPEYFIRKPFRLAELIDLVQKTLNRKAPVPDGLTGEPVPQRTRS